MHKLLMNPEPLAATTKAERRGSTFASLQTVGKLWPAGGKGFRRGPAAREGRSCFSTKDSSHLQLPKWRYKEAKEEKRKAEEAEKQRLAAAQKEKRTSSWRKRT